MRLPLVLLICVLSCARPEEEALAPAETFRWTDQAISFAPPTSKWRREGELSGGVKGVRFVKEHSVGEAITVGEFHRVAERNRTAAIQELIDRFDDMDRRRFIRDSNRADSYNDGAYTERVNGPLARARTAMFNDDRETARAELQNALRAAQSFKLSLADVLEPVALDQLRRQEREFDSFKRRETTVAGEPAVSIEWTFQHNGKPFPRREVFFVHDNHFFVARFIGLEETLPLFERLLASIEFPK